MNRLTFNLNNPVINKDITTPKEVSEYDFWFCYLSCLNITNPVLSDKELIIMSYVLSGDVGTSYFRGKYKDELCEACGVNPRNLSYHYIEPLISKGYLEAMGKKGDYLVSPVLRKFQNFVKQNKTVCYNFTLPFIIKDDTRKN